ncbi:flagellar hook protein FlgE [Pseudomonas sp. KU26590]|uniref:flagellar hook protein FlgE n=1 Tax=Pseudomonas sp. KU26590 TaxID=2991051 RepID=UPI00223D4603|nr:flagellar hook protein FlgE [Pseudomonas sp. KU26590]UZJ62048.1 flagellar hook protein FlgE [Pseudomonas sp. KU26590]
MSFNVGLSGLYAANKSLDVTGNNIANVATTGFKSSRAEFADQYAQSIRGTSGSTNTGSGVTTAAVSQQFTQGTLNTGTGRSLDLAINGNGFFMMSNNGEKLYTRAGAFHTDSAGYIVNEAGNNLQGYSVDGQGNVATGVLSNLRVDSSNLAPKSTSLITVASNLNSSSTVPTVSTFSPSDTSSYTTTYSTPLYDSQGNEHTLDQYFSKTGTNTWTMYSLVDGRSISDPTSTTADATAVTFDSSGGLITSGTGSPDTTNSPNVSVGTDGIFSINNWVPAAKTTVGSTTTWASNGAAANAGGIKLNMLATTQTNAVSGAITKTQDGYATGQITAMNIDATGNMFATYTNGQSKVIGQVSLTNFANVQGLSPAGGTNWRESASSGIPVTGAPQSGTLGYLTGQALEESNVDLTGELVNLIKAQSNYQANAKTISTQSTIMQTIIQMT